MEEKYFQFSPNPLLYKKHGQGVVRHFADTDLHSSAVRTNEEKNMVRSS